jgi:hypothetical protein
MWDEWIDVFYINVIWINIFSVCNLYYKMLLSYLQSDIHYLGFLNLRSSSSFSFKETNDIATIM